MQVSYIKGIVLDLANIRGAMAGGADLELYDDHALPGQKDANRPRGRPRRAGGYPG